MIFPEWLPLYEVALWAFGFTCGFIFFYVLVIFKKEIFWNRIAKQLQIELDRREKDENDKKV